MEHLDWQVDGMTCSNCALTVNKYLQKQGMQEVKVDPLSGKVSFNAPAAFPLPTLKTGIAGLGYNVVDETQIVQPDKRFLRNNKQRFLFCLPFAGVLMLHMFHKWIPGLHWLMNPWVQLALCLPVFAVGMWFFGRSAIKSLQNGVPTMDVLIALGALAAFLYSLTGALLKLGNDYLFFETTSTIITLVFMGNYLEETSVNATQKALKNLVKHQKVMANMIAFDDKHEEQIFPVESMVLQTGDLVLIKTGEQVPADCKIIWGSCAVNEALLTGESLPVNKIKKEFLTGGSIVSSGIVKAQVTAAGSNTVLASIIKMVETAQAEKPPVQQLADRISAIFVPLVIGLSVLTFLISYFGFDISAGASLMRSVAVLVISCPCAMGLATPAAIAVGMGRAAKSGILFRKAASLESFKTIQQVVFDKTGTLTTGNFVVKKFHSDIAEDEFKKVVYSLEKFSTHPIAASLAAEWKSSIPILWKNIAEIKGVGMQATDMQGNVFTAGADAVLAKNNNGEQHSVYVTKNTVVIGWIDLEDEVRPEAAQVVTWLKAQGIHIILLSGDSERNCKTIGAAVGITEILWRHTPAQKLEKLSELNAIKPTAMVGDGINDAPALAKATVGISLSEASQLAMQSADVILLSNGLTKLPTALGLGKHTYLTIQQNLFWAFAYNIVAIPAAAFGFLTPSLSALSMGFSDVILGINSVRLFVKKVI